MRRIPASSPRTRRPSCRSLRPARCPSSAPTGPCLLWQVSLQWQKMPSSSPDYPIDLPGGEMPSESPSRHRDDSRPAEPLVNIGQFPYDQVYIVARGGHEMDDVDVVVVGAGSAGLAAAKTLRDAGLTFTVLEAMDRIGGRAFTSSRAFRHPLRHRLRLAARGRPQSLFPRGAGRRLDASSPRFERRPSLLRQAQGFRRRGSPR